MRLEKESIRAACKGSELPCVHLVLKPEQAVNDTGSKFGGTYWLPAGAKAPNMELLAQIDLSQIPRLKDFPETGLLQFFLCTDSQVITDETLDKLVWKTEDGIFQVRYYPEVSEGQPAQEVIPAERGWLQNKTAGGMEFLPAEEIATLSTDEMGSLAFDLGFESLKEALSSVFQAAWDAEDEEDDEEDEEDEEEDENVYQMDTCDDTDRFIADFGNWGCKLGGHPSIRGDDYRRDKEEYQAYSVLLFQYDLTETDRKMVLRYLEDDTICFFIKPEDLKARRFDDILMTHHNCF